MIASLPMYEYAETADATEAWWRGIARHLGTDTPLSRLADHKAAWRRPDLLLSQTCGYPFTHEFAGKLRLVATPHYGCDGCEGPNYQSIVLARSKAPLEAFRGAAAAVNNPDSMSGMLAMKLVFAPLASKGAFFGTTVETGGHNASMAAVRDGKADVCAIDAVCVAHARRHHPEVIENLVEIARSPMVPGLPYVTVAGDVAALRRALAGAMADPSLGSVRDRLFLTGFSALEPADYGLIVELEQVMEKSGGLVLL